MNYINQFFLKIFQYFMMCVLCEIIREGTDFLVLASAPHHEHV